MNADFLAVLEYWEKEKGISRDSFVSADLQLPNGALDFSTVNTANVTLIRNSDQTLVPSVVNTSGGGDVIVYTPFITLQANTSYTFEVTSGVKDTAGNSFVR